MLHSKSCLDEDKLLLYSNRVLIGNWFESAKLEEHKLNKFIDQMKKGDLMLARYRKMTENLMSPADITQSTGSITFGSVICLFAPHVTILDPPDPNNMGLMLGGRISSNDIDYSQELEDGCSVVMMPTNGKPPCECHAFVITAADYCDRNNENVKFNQEFLLALSSSVKRGEPLYLRYDPNPVPGLMGPYTLYLSKHFVTNARWRFLPKQRPDITRFEQEGHSVKVNEDLIVNHCSTNANLGVNTRIRSSGFYGKVCAPMMKTCLDIYGREQPHNIWQIYVPFVDKMVPEDEPQQK